MKKLTSKEIRNMWLDFWKQKGHEIVPSKSLIPVNDQSILWINSGVATLKDYFTGKKIPNNPRIANSQKSIRTNDIENVGVTARHHTLFEMLGNFSIGDYFKPQAIKWAWELLTKVYKLPKDKIYITYYEEDIETKNLWIAQGVDSEHLIKGNKEMNFWDMGQGPSGPDTEIFYDRGEKFDPENIGLKLLKEDIENDRYVEIWNIVFSQFNNDGQNNYTDLAQKNIDTGAGLERLACIFQETNTNFETDLFMPLINEVEKMSGVEYDTSNYFVKNKDIQKNNRRFRIIADHIRAVTLAIQDGVMPSNTQRGYIIRRLIRIAYRSGLQLGIKDKTFLHSLVKTVAKIMDIFTIDIESVSKVIKKEEMSFAKTIFQGEELLKMEIVKNKNIDFSLAFKLFETYGFPIELTQEILKDKGIDLDISKFEEYKEKHANASRGKKVIGMDTQIQVIQNVDKLESVFVGYEQLRTTSKVFFSGSEGELFYTLLDKTPLYATGGGQHADKGNINKQIVIDVFSDKYGNTWHVTKEKVDANAIAEVDANIRKRMEANHTATHLLNSALRKVFGDQITQLGSDNNEKRLRFDFPLQSRPSNEELQEVEKIVNSYIKRDINREYIETSFDLGKKMGAIALENEDYGENVRVVKFDNIIEFCGGTHIKSTKEVEAFKIIKFESKGSGIFRIEAITSYNDVKQFEKEELATHISQLENITNKIKSLKPEFNIVFPKNINEAKSLIEDLRQTLKQIKKDTSSMVKEVDVEFSEYNGMKAIIILNLEPSDVKQTAISLRDKNNDSLIIAGSSSADKTTLAVASLKFNSKEIFDELASNNNGRGGGNEKFAMGSMDKISL